MKQFKKCKVIMLPTEQKSNIFYAIGHNYFTSSFQQLANTINSDCKGYHLYTISDDEIQDDDWCINQDNVLFKSGNNPTFNNADLYGECKKIIATTDTSLRHQCIMKDGTVTDNYSNVLPQPSQQFIEHFIGSFNQNKIITDVLVEYESESYNNRFNSTKNGIKSENWRKSMLLKINSNNIITIKELKKTWNREELINVFKMCIQDCNSESGFRYDEFDDWIEENL